MVLGFIHSLSWGDINMKPCNLILLPRKAFRPPACRVLIGFKIDSKFKFLKKISPSGQDAEFRS